jgi:hypothetical protein
MLDFEECVRLRTMLERLRSEGYLKEPEYTLPNHETLPYVPRSQTELERCGQGLRLDNCQRAGACWGCFGVVPDHELFQRPTQHSP